MNLTKPGLIKEKKRFLKRNDQLIKVTKLRLKTYLEQAKYERLLIEELEESARRVLK